MINPNYYTKGIPLTEFILSHDIGFAEGCIIKYALRHHEKNGEEDIDKIIRYAELIKEAKYAKKTK